MLIVAIGQPFLGVYCERVGHRRAMLVGAGVAALGFLATAMAVSVLDLLLWRSICAVGYAMVFVAGVPTRYLTRLSIAAAALIALVLVDVLFAPGGKGFVRLGDYQRHRLLVYFGMSFAPPHATEEERAKAVRLERERTYNIRQALISVGSGGLFGKGWGQGTQATLGFLPRNVSQSDFIFSVIAEESGYVGTVVVLGLYSVILFSGLRVAGQARDRLGKLLAVGIVALVFSHVFENIGMNIRLMPVTGIPLPLLSYGGSSVLCTLIAIGILQNVHLHRNQH